MSGAGPPTDPDAPLRGDMTRRETVHLDELDWQLSPGGGVSRKRLHRVGPAESGQVTSLVRYAKGARFPVHDHPEGEEILVLEGVFSDQQGDFGPGTHLLNPEGFRHAPHSEPGCLIFVKLRQYAGEGRPHRVRETRGARFAPATDAPVERLVLYEEEGFPETIALENWPAETSELERAFPGGAEIFVCEGAIEDEAGRHPAPSWIRLSSGTRHRAWSSEGCRLYLKTGGLSALRSVGADGTSAQGEQG